MQGSGTVRPGEGLEPALPLPGTDGEWFPVSAWQSDIPGPTGPPASALLSAGPLATPSG